ncbi:MAG TPA: M20/M25/M40 family metallo-hydrolase [Solirubrobacteraceae bacterium]|jgi:acetylornithine deacetylase/succinyl-diaminopimelate desuccinylase-like protein
MDATALLQQLLRLNTVNPPGNERPAQELLAGILEGAGFDVELHGRTPERPNLVATLRGDTDGPTLGLLSHVDTVLATPEEWEHGPWSGDVADGFVWGRGAIDMKSQTAAEVAAAVTLANEGWRPKGALKVFSVADEETGGGEGAQWLCANKPQLAHADFLLNEGAGAVIPFDGRRVYDVCIAEKGVFRFKLIADGIAGHASMPKIGDNALLKLAPLLQAMADRQPGYDVTDGPRALLEGLGVGPVDGDPTAALQRLREKDDWLGVVVEPMLGVTLAPTKVHASDKINVIPSRAEISVDCRVPPGHGIDTARRRIEEVLGTDGYRIEFAEQVVGNASPVESPLMDVIVDWVAEHEPEAVVVPTILPGFTDSRTWREAFPECIAYGFFPHAHQTTRDVAPLVHSANERIDVRDLELATEFYEYAARRMLG